MRHLEILISGTVPFFLWLDKCPKEALYNFPRELVSEAMRLPGVYPNATLDTERWRIVSAKPYIDFTEFDKDRYQNLLTRLIGWTREKLSTVALANHVLQVFPHSSSQQAGVAQGEGHCIHC